MKYCKYCGNQIWDNTQVCPHCGKKLTPAPAKAAEQPAYAPVRPAPVAKKGIPAWLKKPYLWIALAVLIAVIVIVSVSGGHCEYGNCKNKPVSGSDYCYSHKCAITSCTRSSYTYSNYCYSHHLLYDDDATSNSTYVPSYKLRISNVKVYSSSGYTYAEGTITNNSDTTVSYVKIKGSFENSYGTTVDTDWTYAVGSEGLAPGETCKWKLSVDKDSTIKDCEISILDFDY